MEHRERLPAVDDRLVAPESHAEILDGRVIRTMGSNQPHGMRHFEATGLFFSTLADGFAGAVDMLTRLNEGSDLVTPSWSRVQSERGTEGLARQSSP